MNDSYERLRLDRYKAETERLAVLVNLLSAGNRTEALIKMIDVLGAGSDGLRPKPEKAK